MKRLVILLTVMSLGIVLSASVFAEKPHYTVKRATGRILIDGILDEEDWAAAEPSRNFIFASHLDSLPVENAHAKLLWDDEFLYIAFIAEDSQINVGHAGRNPWNSNTGVSADDCVEFFWIPGTVDTLFYQFEINVVGITLSVFNHKRSSPENRRILLNPPYLGQTFQGTVNDNSDVDKGYVVEIAMRFSDFPRIPYMDRINDLENFMSKIFPELPDQTPKPGDTWMANFNRVNRFADGSRTYSLWSPNILTGPAGSFFHCPRDFGFLHFSDEPVR